MDTLPITALASDWPVALTTRGIDPVTLGGAYLFAIANIILAAAAFIAARSLLVVSPNRAARDYSLHVSFVMTALLVATALENAVLPTGTATLQYAATPHLTALLVIHMWIYYRQEPWLITLGASATAGAVAMVLLASVTTEQIRIAHWLAASLLGLLLGLLWWKSIATKRAYRHASSIYVGSKEGSNDGDVAQRPWLGLPQWSALVAASLGLTVLNAVQSGIAVADVPALQVALEALLLLGITALVCAIPAALYWLARRSWMPELTRFVWLVWLVVGFAFTYGNFLTRLDRV